MDAPPPNARPLILDYRSAQLEPLAPSAVDVLAGLLCAASGVVCLILNLGFWWLAMGLLLGWPALPSGISITSGAWAAAACIGLAATCVWVGFLLFACAGRLFRGQNAARPTQRFTRRSHIALTQANRQALARGATMVDAEHLLLALLDSAPNTAMTLLSNLNVTAPALRQAIDDVAPDPHVPPIASLAAVKSPVLPPTPACGRIIVRAVQLACSEEPQPVGTEHLLLALLRERDPPHPPSLDHPRPRRRTHRRGTRPPPIPHRPSAAAGRPGRG